MTSFRLVQTDGRPAVAVVEQVEYRDRMIGAALCLWGGVVVLRERDICPYLSTLALESLLACYK